jgi:hypothetical protein
MRICNFPSCHHEPAHPESTYDLPRNASQQELGLVKRASELVEYVLRLLVSEVEALAFVKSLNLRSNGKDVNHRGDIQHVLLVLPRASTARDCMLPPSTLILERCNSINCFGTLGGADYNVL